MLCSLYALVSLNVITGVTFFKVSLSTMDAFGIFWINSAFIHSLFHSGSLRFPITNLQRRSEYGDVPVFFLEINYYSLSMR